MKTLKTFTFSLVLFLLVGPTIGQTIELKQRAKDVNVTIMPIKNSCVKKGNKLTCKYVVKLENKVER